MQVRLPKQPETNKNIQAFLMLGQKEHLHINQVLIMKHTIKLNWFMRIKMKEHMIYIGGYASPMAFKGKNRVTQPYGGSHGGIDIVGDDDKNVLSVTSGTVSMVSKWDGKTKTGTQSYGNLVVVTTNGKRYFYAHLASIAVKNGQKVNIGDKIGVMGNTGNSFGAHLHFEVRTGSGTSTRINPAEYCGVKNQRGTYVTEEIPDVIYSVYTDGKWLPEIINCNDYAGNKKAEISGLKAKSTIGLLKIRVHQIEGNRWLPWVNGSDYAGNLGKSIDKVQMNLEGASGYKVQYRVSPKGEDFYPWVTGYNNLNSNGYAGVTKKPIDRIQIRIIKK